MINNVFRDHESLSERRKQQIDTLKIFNDNVTAVIEDVEYKVEFECGGRLMALSVCLGPEFPLEKPVLKISPAVKHQWISHSNEVSLAPGLLNFTVHSDLGRVVQAVVREFELRPPPLIDKTMQQTAQQISKDESSPPLTTSSSVNNFRYSVTNTTSNMPYKDFNFLTSTSFTPQQMYFAFPELNSMTIAELKEVNENPKKLDDLVNSLPITQTLNKNLDEWISKVENLAMENLHREPYLELLKTDIKDKLKSLHEIKAEYDGFSLEYKKLCERFSPISIREAVRLSVAKVDEESERVAEMFLDGNVELDSFLTEYINYRMLSHSRKVKDEKLSQQLEKLQQAGF